MTMGMIIGRRRILPPTQPPDGAPDDLLELVLISDPAFGRRDDRGLDLGDHLVEDVSILGETTGRDLRAGRDLAGSRVDDNDARDEALVPQDAAVLEHGLVGAPDRGPVDVDVAGRHCAHDLGHPVGQVDDDTVLGEQPAAAWPETCTLALPL